MIGRLHFLSMSINCIKKFTILLRCEKFRIQAIGKKEKYSRNNNKLRLSEKYQTSQVELFF